ncbi:hypothetical protein [Noviherbaspirillum sp.]|uniref:hypothetical protein n=1 Tax=Noviherbaspirillum sp. TaxID=1926288 RepID=UPI002D4CBA21|nr:hypothetical protein [Noviherbaspirillum sp.]HZW23567.1 hypothetical protein [Noviherbaspirillum sp.]
MPQSATPERIAILVLVLAATVVAACERRNKHENETKENSALPRAGGRLPAVVPALGIRG